MASAAIASIVDYLAQSRDAVQAAIDDDAFLAAAEAIVDRLVEAIAAGRKVLFAGNGGSAGDAQTSLASFSPGSITTALRSPPSRSPPTAQCSPRSATTTVMIGYSSGKCWVLGLPAMC